MNILHIDSSATGAASVTHELSAAAVKALQSANPDARVTYRDLGAQPLLHVDTALLSVMRPAPGEIPVDMEAPHNAALRAEARLTEQVLGEFLEADAIVIGAPMYNFGIPSTLKAWIDRLAQAGRTFRYTAKGPEGLTIGKRLVIASSRGGVYSGMAHETALDHQEAYLKAVMGFMGVTDVTIIRAEGVAMGPDKRAESVAQALIASAELGRAVA